MLFGDMSEIVNKGGYITGVGLVFAWYLWGEWSLRGACGRWWLQEAGEVAAAIMKFADDLGYSFKSVQGMINNDDM